MQQLPATAREALHLLCTATLARGSLGKFSTWAPDGAITRGSIMVEGFFASSCTCVVQEHELACTDTKVFLDTRRGSSRDARAAY